MSEKTLITFVYSNLFMGGVESYAFRMFDWCKENSYDFAFLIDSKKYFIDETWKNEIEESKITVLNLVTQKKETFSFLKKYKKIICITPTLWSYTSISYFCKKYSINASISLYILYYNFICLVNNKKIDSIFNNFFTSKIAEDTIFMDEETLNFSKSRHPKNKINDHILRLGMKPYKVESLPECKNKRILSICRMDFPFKGYVLGLIDDFSKLVRKYPDLELKIIGDGKNSNDVLEKIKNLSDEFSLKIIYEPSVPYSEINKEIQNACIYVGMGTTLLDASSLGCISIGAVANQTQNKSFGYFYDNPLIVGVCDDIDEYKCQYFYDLIELLLNKNECELLELRKRSIKIVNKYYSIDYVMNFFIANSFFSYKEISKLKLKILCFIFLFFKSKSFWKLWKKIKGFFRKK